MNFIDEGLQVGDKLFHVISGEAHTVTAINRGVLFAIILENSHGFTEAVTATGLYSLGDANPTYTAAPYKINPSRLVEYSRNYVDNVLCLFGEQVTS